MPIAAMNIFAELQAGATTASAAETQQLALRLARDIPANSTLALHGTLGVGKTTFVQGLARGLGIEQPVTSPTFTIFTLHRGQTATLVHLDAYRLETGAQLDTLMIEDFLVSPYCLAIEWPEKISDWLPSGTLHLYFEILSAGRHRVRLDDTKEHSKASSRSKP